jgi:hypothetical protein
MNAQHTCCTVEPTGKSAILKALPYMAKYVQANMARRLAAEIVKVKQLQGTGVAAGTVPPAIAATATGIAANDTAVDDSAMNTNSSSSSDSNSNAMPAYRQIGNRLLPFTAYASYCNKLKKEQRTARAASDSQSVATGKSGFSGMSGMYMHAYMC